ncbi:hypothetical protein AOLI_G00292770 [Acnodon oligacanthus]
MDPRFLSCLQLRPALLSAFLFPPFSGSLYPRSVGEGRSAVSSSLTKPGGPAQRWNAQIGQPSRPLPSAWPLHTRAPDAAQCFIESAQVHVAL